jgi:putative SOS response-associated peptidase YedK
MAIAGPWRERKGNQPPSFTMPTTEPSTDVAPYHNRQVAVLRTDDWVALIHQTRPETQLLRPLSAGSLVGALREIRTPDPQIRSLFLTLLPGVHPYADILAPQVQRIGS